MAAHSFHGWNPVVLLLLLVLPLLLADSRAHAQDGSGASLPYPFEEPWRWVRFDERAGLPSARVTDILDAPDGTPWAVTERGPAWYDGYRWNRSPGDLPWDGIDVLRPFGFFQGRLILRCSGRICLVGTHSLRILAPENVDRAVAFDAESLLLFAGDRLIRYTRDGYDSMPLPPGYDPELRGVACVDGRRRLYYFGWNQLSRYSGGRPVVLLDAGRDRLGAVRMAVNSEGSGCVVIMHPRRLSGIWEWNADGEARRAPLNSSLSPLTLDVADDGKAVVLYEEKRYAIRLDGQWTPIRVLPIDLRGAPRARFRPNGDLWVSTENGLFLCRMSDVPVQSVSWQDGDDRNRINDILRDRNGNVWCATSGGIVRITPGGKQRTWTRILGRSFHIVTGVIEDDEGRIWISSGADFTGVFCWDGTTWSHHMTPFDGNGASIHRMYHGQAGRIWLAGHAPDGSMRSDRNPGVFYIHAGKIHHWEQNDNLSHRRVYAVCEDADRALWFGTYRGLCRWRNGVWTYFDEDRTPGTLYVVSLTRHTDGNLYFGTQYSDARGIGCVDGNDRLHYIDDLEGVAGVTVNEICSDTHDRLWVATDNGLIRFMDGRWSRYGKEIGLQSSKLWPLHVAGDSLLIGTAAMGWALLDTRLLRRHPVFIDAGEAVIEGRDVAISWTPLVHWGAVPPERVYCRYRLDDGNWSGWSRINTIRLRNVAYGEHQFHLQAMGPHGTYDSTGALVRFAVPLPPILRWYILGPLLLLSAVLLGLWIAYVRRRRAHVQAIVESRDRLKTLAEELVHTEEHERRRLAQYLHDVIGQSLSLSYLQLHRWQNRTCPNDEKLTEVRSMLDRVIRDTHTLTFDLCPPFLYELSLNEALIWIADHTEKQHDRRIERSIPDKKLAVHHELHVLLVMGVRELLVNSMKHAHADIIRLTMEAADDGIILRVSDDGAGFPPDVSANGTRRPGGFGLYNMRRRFADFGVDLLIQSAPGSGASVSIHIPDAILHRETAEELHDSTESGCNRTHPWEES